MQAQPNDAPQPSPRKPIAGLLATVIIFVVGGLLLARMAGFGASAAPTPEFMPVTTDISTMAFQPDTPVVAVVTADWCGPCQELKRTTLSDDRVQAMLIANAQTVMIDGTDTEKARATLEELGVRAFPSTIVLKDGQPVAMLEGYADTDKFLAWLEGQL